MKKSKLPKKASNKEQIKKEIERRKSTKKKYKVRNWKEYNESLVNRGSLEFWINRGIIKKWKIQILDEEGKRKRGSQKEYSAQAVEFCRLIGKVFHQRLRQTEGFVKSIFKMADVEVEIPDYSTLSRHGGKIKITLPKKDKEKVVAILDSTGLKVYGEGEWKVRKHGYSKHREWMKVHVSIDADGEIRAVKLTDNSVDDAKGGEDLLLEQKTDNIHEIDADGAYDKKKFYKVCRDRYINKINIPPREGAKIWHHGNRKEDPHPRDENLRAVRKSTRKRWKELSGYHKRSKAENTMFRFKTIFGDKLNSRTVENQETEVMLMAKALNLMMNNGMPESYAVI